MVNDEAFTVEPLKNLNINLKINFRVGTVKYSFFYSYVSKLIQYMMWFAFLSILFLHTTSYAPF